MQTIASGRVAFWQGGSLWVFDVLGAAAAPSRNDMHAHHAFQLTFALGGEFVLHLEDRELFSSAAVVAPDVPHAFEARGLVGLLFIEPESRAGRAMAHLISGEPGKLISAEQARDAPQLFKQAFADPTDHRSAMRDAGMLVCDRIAGHVRSTEPDRRVRGMIRWASEHLDAAPAINAAAESVGLSPSRASHLFVEETGLPFRTYVLWLRVTRAVDAYAAGASLTSAAQAAGFADSAHLSRTFKRMFGMPAASLEMS